MLPHEELRIGKYHLLVVEREQGLYRLYVGVDGKRYAHYDTGEFSDLRQAVAAARHSFDPGALKFFPYAPFDAEVVIDWAPHAFESVADDSRRG